MATGVFASSLALNFSLSKPYTDSTWLTGQYLAVTAEVCSGLAALLVIGAWWSERGTAIQPPRPDVPTPRSPDQPD